MAKSTIPELGKRGNPLALASMSFVLEFPKLKETHVVELATSEFSESVRDKETGKIVQAIKSQMTHAGRRGESGRNIFSCKDHETAGTTFLIKRLLKSGKSGKTLFEGKLDEATKAAHKRSIHIVVGETFGTLHVSARNNGQMQVFARMK